MAFFQWWYGPGWAEQIKAISKRTRSIADMFSIGILLRTLFAPWKQITSRPHADQSVNLKMHAGVDNIISRLVGFSVRTMVMIAALLTTIISGAISIIIAIIWPILPWLVLFLIPLGFAL